MVDDEPSVLQLLKVNLEAEGHETSLAGDGATALTRIRQDRPHLVVLDLMMPSLDGWQVLEQLGQMRGGRRPKIIVLTAKGGADDKERALALGADGFVTKPFEVDELMGLVGEMIED